MDLGCSISLSQRSLDSLCCGADIEFRPRSSLLDSHSLSIQLRRHFLSDSKSVSLCSEYAAATNSLSDSFLSTTSLHLDQLDSFSTTGDDTLGLEKLNASDNRLTPQPVPRSKSDVSICRSKAIRRHTPLKTSPTNSSSQSKSQSPDHENVSSQGSSSDNELPTVQTFIMPSTLSKMLSLDQSPSSLTFDSPVPKRSSCPPVDRPLTRTMSIASGRNRAKSKSVSGFLRLLISAKKSKKPASKSPCRLSLEQLEKWQQSLSDCLADEAGCKEFTKFVTNEYSAENMMFWKMCKGYTSNPSTELANAIYSQFIKESAVCQVNLDQRSRLQIEERIACADPEGTLYNRALGEILELMSRDSYMRFLGSAAFQAIKSEVIACS